MEAPGQIQDFIQQFLTHCVFLAVLTKDLLAFLTWSANTEPPFLTHTYTNHGVTYTQQLSAYQHSPHTAPAFPPCSPFSHTATRYIHHKAATHHINSAAFLSASPALLPDILSVFLRASQEISFYKAAKPTHTTHNILKRLSGARQALNLTHTRIFQENNTTASTLMP